MEPVAYRELWRSDRARKYITVVVYGSGERKIVGHPSVASRDVLNWLESDGFVFRHLLPREAASRSRSASTDHAYEL